VSRLVLATSHPSLELEGGRKKKATIRPRAEPHSDEERRRPSALLVLFTSYHQHALNEKEKRRSTNSRKKKRGGEDLECLGSLFQVVLLIIREKGKERKWFARGGPRKKRGKKRKGCASSVSALEISQRLLTIEERGGEKGGEKEECA